MLRKYWDTLGFILFLLFPLLLVSTRAGADICLSLIGLLFLSYCAWFRNFAWVSRLDTYLIIGLWGAVLLSGLGTPGDSKLLVHIAWVRFPLFYLAVRHWLLADIIRCHHYTKWICIVLALVALDACIQYVFGTSLSGHIIRPDGRLTGALTHPNIGNYLTKLLFPSTILVLWYLLAHQQRFGVAALLCGVLGISAMVLLSGERSISLLLLLGIAIMEVGALIFLPRARIITALFGVVFAGIATLLFFTQHITQARGHQLASDLGNFWQTPYGQLFIGGFTFWKHSPIFA